MGGVRTSIALAFLMVGTLFSSFISPLESDSNTSKYMSENIFHGFTVDDDWLDLEGQPTAVPNGFDPLTLYDYSDVGVLINNKSESSKTIGWAFVEARNISLERVFIFDADGTPTGEQINRNQFNEFFAYPFLEMLGNRSNVSDMNYLVSNKGIPLKVNGGNNKASFDQEFSLLGGSYNSSIAGDYWETHSYGPLAGGEFESFSRQKHGFYLVTRLTGYTVDTALQLIEKANNSLGQRGTTVLDLATNRNESGYKFWNDDLYAANTTLTETYNQTVIFDEETGFVTNISNVMGYASWGSNDGNWDSSLAQNSGFDTASSSWSSGVKHWNATAPSLSSGDTFAWSYQTQTKKAGNGAIEAAMSATCSEESGNGTQGIYSEFFDNEGVSFNTGSMPSLIDRVPDHVRLESSLQYNSMNAAYPGLDDRFKNNWGARFSGLIDIPDTGNWTFFLTSDDGSELWIDGVSIVTNYGSHGMRELSGFRNLTAGLHDFRVEFFQGGGPHGLKLQWSGPNQSKALVPSTAFFVASATPPSPSTLLHAWNFDEGVGMETNDSVDANASLTLSNMNSSNWRSCPDGGCLWFDGVDDYVEVDVDDWVGDFTVSQWVWANSTTLPNYASVFAVSDNAGSNTSFQHTVFNGEWRLHNNQTHAFGDVEAQQWMHLVTVFESGNVRQYFDGVLVRTTTFPTGSINNIDLYKLGVNRGQSTFFEGMIDKVMIWESALTDGDVTRLHRDIYRDCSAYSGSGTSAASLEQSLLIPSEVIDHAWIASVSGSRSGDVYGSFSIIVEAVDQNGNILSTNTSSSKPFETNWADAALRFRPDPNATALRIRIPIDVVATSTSGSVFLDSLSFRAIRPHMTWIDGSIAETAVSTGGRSFTIDTTYGQSLVADLLEDGVSGVKGYVYEPYLTAVGQPSVLFGMYSQGFSFAEANAAANTYISWMGVTVGDPKMAPYIDTIHDIHILDARLQDKLSVGQTGFIEVGLENLGMADAEGELEIINVQGSVLMTSSSISVPAGDLSGSRTSAIIPVTPTQSGWLDVRIRYTHDNTSSFERDTENNFIMIRFWVNSAPSIDSVYCDQPEYARGDSFLCTVLASDDEKVESVTLGWTVLCSTCVLNNTTWLQGPMGTTDNGSTWEAMITLPINISTGGLALHVIAIDKLGMQDEQTTENVSQVLDAAAAWFGPHASSADSSWLGVTPLPSTSPNGILRGVNNTITGCVLDVDHNTNTERPQFLVERGTLGELVYVEKPDSNHHCYETTFFLENGSSLTSIPMEMRTNTGSLVMQRTIKVEDIHPTIDIRFVNSNNTTLDRIIDNNDEFIIVRVEDVDDTLGTYLGDIELSWPGFGSITLPIEGQVGGAEVAIKLNPPRESLESGDVIFDITIQDSNGATSASTASLPLFLNAPLILEMVPCTMDGQINELMFGHTAVLGAKIISNRPMETIDLSLRQLGWTVSAPPIEAPTWSFVSNDCMESLNDENTYWFRLQLDGSFASETGSIQLVTKTIDGYLATSQVPMLFRHAPPILNGTAPQSVQAGTDLVFQVEVTDLDGLNDVQCSASVYSENASTDLWNRSFNPIQTQDENGMNTLRWPLPRNLNESTDSIRIEVNCSDLDNEYGQWQTSTPILIEPYVCVVNCNASNTDERNTKSEGSQSLWVYVVLLIVVIAGITLVLQRRKEKIEKWATDESLDDLEQLTSASIAQAEASLPGLESSTPAIPDGWTEEAFAQWLQGECPEEWTESQWEELRGRHSSLLSDSENTTDEILF